MKLFRGLIVVSAIMLASVGIARPADAQDVFDQIKSRGTLVCPVPSGGGLVGFSEIDNNNQWRGFDVDMCRALATAIVGSPQAARFTQVSWAQRFPSLQSGQLDIIVMATGWSLSRDTELGFQFSRPYFYGGIQLLTKASFNAKSATDLSGATFCTIKGTTGERAVNDYLAAKKVRYSMITFDNSAEMREAYLRGRCDVQTGWGPSLFVTRLNAPTPSDHVVLSDLINLEALSVLMRPGSKRLLNAVNWTLTALIEADELGLTQANVEKALAERSDDPRVARLLGKTPGIGAKLGLPEDWALKVIKAVGNYSEIYERNLGSKSPLGMPPGQNQLWTNGGLLHSLLID